jgi:hypothetical protein
MSDVQITCINKTPRTDTHEGITHVGGSTWKRTRQQAVDLINSGTDTFYTKVNGVRADVAVRGDRPNQYLQTHADGKWNNNLLALPECS